MGPILSPGHTHTLCLEKNATTQGCNQVVLLSTHNVTQHLKITFLSRLDVTKNLQSGLQSHDQMIRLCMAVSFSVCAYSENRGSIWKREQRAREIIQTTAFKRWYECRHYMYCVTFHLHNNTFPTKGWAGSKTLCYDYCSMTSARLDPCLTAQ